MSKKEFHINMENATLDYDEKQFLKLRHFNLVMGSLHFLQGLMMLILSLTWDKIIDFKPQIYGTFLGWDDQLNVLVNRTDALFLLPFGILVSVFLFLSAFFHFFLSLSDKMNKIYNDGLKNHTNVFRWIEYSLSSSLMIVLIATLFGINDIFSLILIFSLNASMNFFGLLMETKNKDNPKVDWSPFIFGAIAGIIPWIVIFITGFAKSNLSEIPWFVYAIFFSYFVFFNLFPINMVLQYKRVGKWKDYIYGERVYITLSLVAKTILAWLVLFGVMQPN